MTRRLTTPLIGAALLALSFQPAVGAQEMDVEAEIQALKDGQDAIRKELAEIKRSLAARPAARGGSNQVAGKLFNLAGNPVQGVNTAKLTLVEFTDYQ